MPTAHYSRRSQAEWGSKAAISIRQDLASLVRQEQMDAYEFLLGTLSVWRVTHLLQAEDGPGDVVVHLRRSAGTGFWGQLLDCFYCLSVWIAAPFAFYLGKTWSRKVLLWLALSAAAILLERATDRQHGEAPASYIEESEDEYVLRQKAGRGSSDDPGASGAQT
jgi:hypothetical protein